MTETKSGPDQRLTKIESAKNFIASVALATIAHADVLDRALNLEDKARITMWLR